MTINEFLERGDWDLMEKAAKCKSIMEFTQFTKKHNIEIDEQDFENVYNFVCKRNSLKKISDDELYMVAGGKDSFKNVDNKGICEKFVPASSELITDEEYCENCIHARKTKGNLFMKEHIICDIGRGSGYKSPNNIFN